jgi:hypothetical protein
MGVRGKKRGRPRKKRPEETPEYWKDVLHDHHLGLDRADPDWLVLECMFVKQGRTVPLEAHGLVSITRPRSASLSLKLDCAADEAIVLPAPWLRYLKYMDVVAEARSPKDTGAGLKRLFLEDARSRYWEQPPEIPKQLGTPAEFRERWAHNELEIRLQANRRKHLIRIVVLPIPPDEPEDLDETDEPNGHWAGLTWIPGPPRDRRS